MELPDLRWHQEIIIYTNKITNNQGNHLQPQDQVQKKTMYHLPKSRHLFSYRCPLHLPPRHLASTMDILYPLWEVGQGLMGDPHLDPLGVNAMPQLEVNQCLLLILTGFTGHRLCQDSGLLRPLVAKETTVINETLEWWGYIITFRSFKIKILKTGLLNTEPKQEIWLKVLFGMKLCSGIGFCHNLEI